MTKPLQRDAIYLKRHFDAEIIVLSVRWYITYKLSYRDLAAMMAERAVVVSHTTIMRWVIRYAPEFEKRWSRFSRSVGCSWVPVHLRAARNRRILGRPIDSHATAHSQSVRSDLSLRGRPRPNEN